MRKKAEDQHWGQKFHRLLNFSHSWLKGTYYYIYFQLHIFIVVVLHNSVKNNPRLSHGLFCSELWSFGVCVRACVCENLNGSRHHCPLKLVVNDVYIKSSVSV